MPSRFQVQLAMQRRATDVLIELLTHASREKLPLLNWTIGSSGVQVTGFSYRLPSTERRQDITAWAQSLGIRLREHPGPEATTIMGTSRRFRTSYGGGEIMLVCDVYHDEDQAAGHDQAERNYVVPGAAEEPGR